MAEVDFDVAILGGGPGGGAAGSYLARAGLKCVIFERELFPRQHVGESLVPASNRVLADLGLIEQMDENRFPRKFGAVWTSAAFAPVYNVDWEGLGDSSQSVGTEEAAADIRFEERAQPGVNLNYTWHVDRGKFDNMILNRASQLGATVYEGMRVQGVDFADPTMPKVRVMMGRQELNLRTRMVIDASGRHTLLGNQLRLKVTDPIFDQYAIHAWFENLDRLAMAKKEMFGDYIFVHFLPVNNTWIWQIPITETITSVGVVTQKRNFQKTRQSREQFFWECVDSRKEFGEALRAAKQLRPLKDEGDYSYSMKQICGDGFVLVGDAARFVDPIFSSGVSIALNSAKLASQDIVAAANNGGFHKMAFNNFEAMMRRGTRNWHEFIALYYRLNVLFTFFIQDRRYRLDVLKLLQGDMYDEERPKVLQEMARVVGDVEKRPNHPWHKLLNDLTCDAFRPEQ
ncbi:MAG TPA: NAD(P)/FAD-dependent oxidoreductase [Candidatus Binataceae bacterium]|nr:NAD(P)/FAD-dependent oxidoreductase [Candidatus Binataceae bacterium]